jgi:hypothetical protein
MGKYELTIDSNYIPGWNIVDAVREFFQNAIDQAAVCKDNPWGYKYDIWTNTLSIWNKKSVLEAKTLLLGNTNKAEDDRTIGTHGEGYKVATLVALRCGKNITFYNYGKKEIWKPKMVNSRRFGAPILTFFTEKFIWKQPPTDDLTITIEGITQDEWDAIVKTNLWLRGTKGKIIQTTKGRILMDPEFTGEIYVNGLFVRTEAELNYGYDILPQYLKLDRDRKMVSSFDLQWFTSQMWGEVKDDIVIEVVKSTTADARYLGSQLRYTNILQSTLDKANEDFRDHFGEKAIPVSSQTELSEVQDKYQDAKAVLVPESYKALIIKSDEYEIKAQPKTPLTLEDRLLMWIAPIRSKLTDSEYNRFLDIIGKTEEAASDLILSTEEMLEDIEQTEAEMVQGFEDSYTPKDYEEPIPNSSEGLIEPDPIINEPLH